MEANDINKPQLTWIQYCLNQGFWKFLAGIPLKFFLFCIEIRKLNLERPTYSEDVLYNGGNNTT